MTFEQWMVLIPTLCSSVGALIVAIIGAVRQREIHRQVVPPSQPKGGRTLGGIVEGVAVASQAAALESARVRKALSDQQAGTTTDGA